MNIDKDVICVKDNNVMVAMLDMPAWECTVCRRRVLLRSVLEKMRDDFVLVNKGDSDESKTATSA